MAGQQFFDILAMSTKGTKGPANAVRLAADAAGVVYSSVKGAPFALFGSGGFGDDVSVTKANASGISRTISEWISAYTDNVNLTEDSKFTLRLLRNGSQVDIMVVDSADLALQINNANSSLTTYGMRVNSTGTQAIIGGSINGTNAGSMRFGSGGDLNLVSNGANISFYTGGDFGVGALLASFVPGVGITFNTRLLGKRSATTTAAALTITLPTDAFTYPVSVGTGTINAIAQAGWVAGAWGMLDVASGVTLTHNVAGAGGSVPILTPTAASIVTASKRSFLFSYDGSNFILAG